jgi:hypothetical protein
MREIDQQPGVQLWLLVGILGVIIVLAGFGLFLAQEPAAPLPWLSPTPSATRTLLPPSPTITRTPAPTDTPTVIPTLPPRRQPTGETQIAPTIASASQTPGAESTGTQTPSTTQAPTVTQGSLYPGPVTDTPVPQLTGTNTSEPTQLPTVTNTFIPQTATSTSTQLPSGATLLQGRLLLNGAPVQNAIVDLEGLDLLNATTDADGRYRFEVTGAPFNYNLVFSLEENPQLTPADQIATWAWLEGYLPAGATQVDLPDLEISLNRDSFFFQQVSPDEGAQFSASQISSGNPITFRWDRYSGALSYWVDIYLQGDDVAIWQSDLLSATTAYFDGTLDDGDPITEGQYWWNIGSYSVIEGFKMYAYGHDRALIIVP